MHARGGSCACPGDVCAWGRACPGQGEGMFAQGGGVCAQGCVHAGGGGVCPLSVHRQTDTCENITFANFICGQ